MNKKNITLAAIFFVMFILASSAGLRGLLVPSWREYYQVDSTAIGLLFSIATIASIPTASLSGWLCQTIGYKKTVLMGISLCAVSYALLPFATHYPLFILGNGVLTAGGTMIALAINTVVTVIKVKYQAILVNMIHFSFGVGLAVSQQGGGLLLGAGVDWRTLFWGIVLFYIAGFLVIVLTDLPKAEARSEQSKTAAFLKDPVTILLILTACVYGCAEGQTGNWLVNYLNQLYGYDASKAGQFAAIFFATFSMGRFLGGFIAERLGYWKSVGSFLAISSVMFAAGLLLGERGLLLVTGSGFFFSLIFPTLTLIIANRASESKASALGFQSMLGNLFALLASMSIGFMNDWIGVELTFWIMPLFLITASALFMAAIRMNRAERLS